MIEINSIHQFDGPLVTGPLVTGLCVVCKGVQSLQVALQVF